MGVDKKDIIHAINTSAKELQQGIDSHCSLVTAILEKKVDEHSILPLLDMCPKRSRERKLENAVKEAIDVIEDSRKAFKSRKLEALRKKLTAVLIEND